MFSVYVYLGEHDAMVDLLSNLENRGLLATGEYVVIHVNLDSIGTLDTDPGIYFRRNYKFILILSCEPGCMLVGPSISLFAGGSIGWYVITSLFC